MTCWESFNQVLLGNIVEYVGKWVTVGGTVQLPDDSDNYPIGEMEQACWKDLFLGYINLSIGLLE